MPRTYAPELKAQVIAEWLAGASSNALAKKHGIPRPTVAGWLHGESRQVTIPQPDLREAFGMSVYSRAMEALDALGAHLRAAARPEFAGTVEGWSDRTEKLRQTVIALGSAIQAGSPEPIAVGPSDVIDA